MPGTQTHRAGRTENRQPFAATPRGRLMASLVRRLFAFGGLLVAALMLVALSARPARAQGGGPFLAFVNGSGQLAVASGDGAYRWIVTNPGEMLHRTLGYSWSPGGRQLFFALDYGEISLRVADLASQQVYELGRAPGTATGGYWTPDGSAVLLAHDNRLVAFPAGGGPFDLAAAGGPITLRSPFDAGSERPHLASARNVAPGGQFLFYAQGSANVVQPVGGAPITLMGGDPTGPYSGLWADVAPLVAYTGFNANSFLAVTNAASGATVMLDSGRTAPIYPLGWRPGTLQLIYRDATSFVRLADLTCLTASCPNNPLAAGLELLPASAVEVQMDGNWVYFVDGVQVQAVPLSCVNAGSCTGSAVTLATNAAPQSVMDAGGAALVYTAFNADPYNPADREIRAVDLNCLGNPATCAPRTLLPGAVNGLVSPTGAYVVAEQGGSLHALRLADGLLTYLTDSGGGALLTKARWSPV